MTFRQTVVGDHSCSCRHTMQSPQQSPVNLKFHKMTCRMYLKQMNRAPLGSLFSRTITMRQHLRCLKSTEVGRVKYSSKVVDYRSLLN